MPTERHKIQLREEVGFRPRATQSAPMKSRNAKGSQRPVKLKLKEEIRKFKLPRPSLKPSKQV